VTDGERETAAAITGTRSIAVRFQRSLLNQQSRNGQPLGSIFIEIKIRGIDAAIPNSPPYFRKRPLVDDPAPLADSHQAFSTNLTTGVRRMRIRLRVPLP